MKKVVFAFALLLTNIAFAQKFKVDLDPKRVSFENVVLPKFYTEPANRTFQVLTNNSSEYTYYYDNDSYNRKIAINGFTRSTSAPYVTIEVMLDPSMENGGGVVTSSSKNSNGVTTTTYAYKVAYKCNGKYVVNYGGTVKSYSLSKEYSTTSSSFASYSQAATGYDNNKYSQKENFSRQFAEYSIQTIYDNINSLYGYRIVKQDETLWILDSKDNPEYAAHQDAFAKINTQFATITYNNSPESAYQELKPIIEYLESVKTKYNDPEDKKQKKMRYASYYNLMKIYLALDMFDKAQEQASGLVTNDYDTNDGTLMITKLTDLKSRLTANNVTTTHMKVEPIYMR